MSQPPNSDLPQVKTFPTLVSAAKLTSFENMSTQEDKFGFHDNTEKNKLLKKKFFNLGPNNQWQKYLSKDIQNKVENAFENEMKELNYL